MYTLSANFETFSHAEVKKNRLLLLTLAIKSVLQFREINFKLLHEMPTVSFQLYNSNFLNCEYCELW